MDPAIKTHTDKTACKKIIGYKVIKDSPDSDKQLAQHFNQGWVMSNGFCKSDRYGCQALIKFE